MGNRGRINKVLVHDDQWNFSTGHRSAIGLGARNDASINQILFNVVTDQIAGHLTGIDVQPGQTNRMVMVEQQACALLVGVVVGDCSRAGIRHIRHILGAGATLERGNLSGRGNPLVGGAITDPGA